MIDSIRYFLCAVAQFWWGAGGQIAIGLGVGVFVGCIFDGEISSASSSGAGAVLFIGAGVCIIVGE